MTDLHDLDRELRREDHLPDSIVVFTESQSDANFYNRLAGRRLRRHVRFVAPKVDDETEGEGWRGAFDACANARRKASESGLNENRFYCLLDGEEAVRWGRGFDLFDARTLLFKLEDPVATGVLFLNCYEKENLYLLYGNALEEIEYNLDLFGELRPRPVAHDVRQNASDTDKMSEEEEEAWKTLFANAKIYQRQKKPKKNKKRSRGFKKQSPRKFGRHNAWQAVARSLLHAGLVAACKRPRGADRANLYCVSKFASLEFGSGRLFEEAIYYRNGEYIKKYGSRNESRGKIEEDEITLEYWSELLTRFRRLKLDSGLKGIKQNPFAPELLRLCDGKVLLEWLFNMEHAAWERTYEQRLIDSGFGIVFRNALIKVLLDDACHAPATAPAAFSIVRPPPPPLRSWLIARR